MYSTLSLKRLLVILALPPVIIFVLVAVLTGTPQTIIDGWRLAKSVVSYWSIAFVVIGAGTAWWAPWRLLWKLPLLNRWIFPDLNGTWVGHTNSNWPTVKAMYDSYAGLSSPEHGGPLDQIPLQGDAIKIRIVASFFKFRVEATLSSTGGKSRSIGARVLLNEELERYEVYYTYIQETPTPEIIDEASHVGAARLILDMKEWTLGGEYWTRRSWRSGLNTAGLLEVKRIAR